MTLIEPSGPVARPKVCLDVTLKRQQRSHVSVRLWLALMTLAASLQLCLPDRAQADAIKTPLAPPSLQLVTRGEPGNNGNLLAIQPWLTPQHFASAARLKAELHRYLSDAQKAGLLSSRTVAVLPEYTGTWLVLSGEKPRVLHAPTSTKAMLRLLLRHPFEFLRARGQAHGQDRTTEALFRLKAPVMARDYEAVMGSLAHEFGITLVGGSILLPGPGVSEGRLTVDEALPLMNASVVFGADGRVVGSPIIKVFLTREEQAFLSPGTTGAWPLVDTPAGRLGVLVCADAWFPQSYQALLERSVSLVAVPTFISGDSSWQQPWHGYSGQPTPNDVATEDVDHITEGEAWKRYTLPGRLRTSGARAGVLVPLRGALWELGDSGEPLTVLNGEAQSFPAYDGPMLINVWL